MILKPTFIYTEEIKADVVNIYLKTVISDIYNCIKTGGEGVIIKHPSANQPAIKIIAQADKYYAIIKMKLLNIYSGEMKTYVHTKTFIAALFTVV